MPAIILAGMYSEDLGELHRIPWFRINLQGVFTGTDRVQISLLAGTIFHWITEDATVPFNIGHDHSDHNALVHIQDLAMSNHIESEPRHMSLLLSTKQRESCPIGRMVKFFH